jgi:hypothetical protein
MMTIMKTLKMILVNNNKLVHKNTFAGLNSPSTPTEISISMPQNVNFGGSNDDNDLMHEESLEEQPTIDSPILIVEEIHDDINMKNVQIAENNAQQKPIASH